MKITLSVCQVQDLSNTQVRQLKKLCRKNGQLSDILSHLLYRIKHNLPTYTHRVVLAAKGEMIVGWAMMFKYPNYNYTELMLYVKRAYRRMGIGSSLLTKAKGLRRGLRMPKLRIYPMRDQGDFFLKNRLTTQKEYERVQTL